MVLLLVAVGAGGCRRQPVRAPATPGEVGGATPRDAVHAFMAAAKAQDLDAMSLVWGSAAGPARATMDRATWEMREVVMMTCLKHDSYRVIGEAPAAGGDRVLLIEIKFKDLTRSTNFTLTRDNAQRWFVLDGGIESLRDICVRKA